jgi:hypothetical protein
MRGTAAARFLVALTAAVFFCGAAIAQEGAPAPATPDTASTQSPAPQVDLPQAQPEKPITWTDTPSVVLRTIDKVSARTGTFEIPVGKTMKFGKSLFIRAEVCRKSGALDKPESASFLRIWERKPTEEKPVWVFSGWMFASSPSLSAMDHPVYDVWVIDCKAAAKAESSAALTNESEPDTKPAATPAPDAEEDAE